MRPMPQYHKPPLHETKVDATRLDSIYRILHSRPSLCSEQNIPHNLVTCQKELVYYQAYAKRKVYEIKDLRDENRGLGDENKDLRGESKGHRDKIEDLRDEIKDLRDEIKDLRGESKGLHDEIEDLRGGIMLQVMSSLVLVGLMISKSR